jgi:acetyl-CoA carboxylase carboxyltransferase component
MGGAQAGSVLLDIKLKQAEHQGKHFSDSEKKKLLDEIMISYEEQINPLYAAARLWVDEIIDPALSREYISMALESANNNPHISEFKTGVIQT